MLLRARKFHASCVMFPILLFSTCCHLSRFFPLGNNTIRLPKWPHNYHLLFSSSCPFLPLSLFSSPPSLSCCLCKAHKHRRSVRKAGSEAHSLASPPSASSSPVLYPTVRSPPPPPLTSFLPPSSTLLSPCLLSPSLCLVAPLIHYISTPLLRPPLTPPSFFLVHNM